MSSARRRLAAGSSVVADPRAGWTVRRGASAPVIDAVTVSMLQQSPAILRLDDSPDLPFSVGVGFGLVPTADLGLVPDDPMELAALVRLAATIEIHGHGRSVALVVGRTMSVDTALVRALDTADVVLATDDRLLAAGLGCIGAGHPLLVLARVIGERQRQAGVVAAGELVATGVRSGMVPMPGSGRLTGVAAGLAVYAEIQAPPP